MRNDGDALPPSTVSGNRVCRADGRPQRPEPHQHAPIFRHTVVSRVPPAGGSGRKAISHRLWFDDALRTPRAICSRKRGQLQDHDGARSSRGSSPRRIRRTAWRPRQPILSVMSSAKSLQRLVRRRTVSPFVLLPAPRFKREAYRRWSLEWPTIGSRLLSMRHFGDACSVEIGNLERQSKRRIDSIEPDEHHQAGSGTEVTRSDSGE